MKSSILIETVETNASLEQRLVETGDRLTALAEGGGCASALSPLLRMAAATSCEARDRIAAQEARIRELESLSVTDEVTGLFNRRGFDTEFDRTIARARRSGERGLLVLCDLDRFKAINDTYGHPAGDAALAGTALYLRQAVRDSDIVARLGGDEFGLILIDADPKTAATRMAPLRDALGGFLIEAAGNYVPISASLGYTAYGPNSDADTAMALADKALYRGKCKTQTGSPD